MKGQPRASASRIWWAAGASVEISPIMEDGGWEKMVSVFRTRNDRGRIGKPRRQSLDEAAASRPGRQ